MLSKLSIPTRKRARAAPLAATLAATLAILLLAAWALPPRLDWGRFRTQIAAIAAARLGRPVTIGGDITLRLLPQAILTASDVTLPDQGDGISVQVSALRLQVATLPLLTGHLRLRDLTLSAPVLKLPLTLPETLVHPKRPQIPHAFAARIEAGTLRIGQTEITGITAAIHGGPAIASTATSMPEIIAPGGIPVAAFGAEGFATAAGRTWRFTSALGAPDADGVSAVDISVRGQGPAADTGATLQATLADGILQGRLRAGGPDLSQLVPAAAQAWRADTPFIASTDRIEANAIRLSLGDSPAEGALVLQLNAPATLEGQLHATSLDLDGWASLLGRTFTPTQQPAHTLPRLHVALAAEQARLLGGTLRNLHGILVSDGKQLGLDQAHALLPGNATLEASQARFTETDANGAPAPLVLAATASLTAPDLPATLAWLHPLAPIQLDSIPSGTLPNAKLSGKIILSRTGLSASGLTGQIGATSLAGTLALHPSQHPALEATLALDKLNLDPWLGAWPATITLAKFGQAFTNYPAFTGSEASLHITADHAAWRATKLEHLALDARTSPAGLNLEAASADLAGAHLTASGNAGSDGRLLAAKANLVTQNLAGLRQFLPTSLAPYGLWQGPARIAVAADGPPEALALQLRADLSDLVLEAEATCNTKAGSSTATLTLRHPGAPRLLAALGLPGTTSWLDNGSLTLRAHLQTTPTQITAQDFDLAAAALRLNGHLQADWSTQAPTIIGAIHAEQLALPASLPPFPLASLASLAAWSSQLHVTANNVTVALRPVLQNLAADVATAGPDVLINHLSATLATPFAGAALAGQIAADLTTPSAAIQATLTNAVLSAPLAAGTAGLDAGQLTLSVEGWAPGLVWDRLQGEAHAWLKAARFTGASLTALPKTLPRTRAARAQLQLALTQGSSANLAGALNAIAANGKITLSPSRLTSPEGTIALSGRYDPATGTADLHAALTQAAKLAPTFGLRLTGPPQALHALPEARAKPAP